MTDAIVRFTEVNGYIGIKLIVANTETSTYLEMFSASDLLSEISERLRSIKDTLQKGGTK